MNYLICLVHIDTGMRTVILIVAFFGLAILPTFIFEEAHAVKTVTCTGRSSAPLICGSTIDAGDTVVVICTVGTKTCTFTFVAVAGQTSSTGAGGIVATATGNGCADKGVKVGEEFLITYTTFFPTPESPIGAIALIGSAVGALGAYMFVRSRMGVMKI